MTSSLTNAEKRYTEADMLEAQKKAFFEGGQWRSRGIGDFVSTVEYKAEIRRRYPDPKEPTVVTTERGDRIKIVDGKVLIECGNNREAWAPMTFSPSDLIALGEIAQAAQQEMGKD